MSMTRGALALFGILVGTTTAGANAGRPYSDAQRTGEPAGIIDVAIAREELVIDMRPIEYGGRALVSATYHLENRGDAKALDLVFASGSASLGQFRVTLDGKPVEARFRHDTAELPPTWRAPSETPDPDGGTLGFYIGRDDRGTEGFRLLVPSGAHVLAISYDAEAMIHHANRPVLMHQFAYVLAPARTWAGFGGLAVAVHVPPGWIAAVTPEMTRTVDTLAGTYPNVPADAIAITIHAPTGAHSTVQIAGIVVFIVSIFAGGWLVHRIAFVRERRRARKLLLPAPGGAALGLALLWSALVITTGMLAIMGPDWVLPAGQVDHRGLGDAIAAIGVGLLGMILFVVGLVVGVRTGRSAHPSETTP